MKLSLNLNGQKHEVDVDPNTPLLWVIRDHLKLTGTKFGCGMAQCGACTVHMNGSPIRSCVTPVSSVQNQQITTIEGLLTSEVSREASAVVNAWEDIAVVQCGYCQSGQIMSATALLKQNPNPSEKDIDDFMSGNICRCSTYVRIKQGIQQAAQSMALADAGHTAEPLYYDAAESNPQGGDHHVA
ncbi:(2Fe-2S)-binding protein [Litoribrevibacter albus]|uniref:(2Fe-2S)-binding protein n=1 Tax=Litoribrevibacter albus TaxID=1473156 RepID=A0AA37SBQ9_9GAMM|nr:(2Fe-2S)-binding protein [Litoribrevibacter albus]GLQ32304.1 (2Fe-2S)-binding protein [Litoribrevibacter albus]